MDWMCPVDWFDQGPKPNQGSSHYAGLDEVILGRVFIAGGWFDPACAGDHFSR